MVAARASPSHAPRKDSHEHRPPVRPPTCSRRLAALYATRGRASCAASTPGWPTSSTATTPQADEVIRHGIRLCGKRLRPALLLLAGQAVGRFNDDHITLAAVVEMIHTATLVHDDVLDEAAIRRHEDTVNARWNNETSVLLGRLPLHPRLLPRQHDSKAPTPAARSAGRRTSFATASFGKRSRAVT